MRYFLLFYIIFQSSLPALAQVQEETLLDALHETSPDLQDSLYYELFRTAYNKGDDFVTAKNYALRSLQLSNKYGHSYIYTKSCRALGLTYNRLENFDSAKYYYSKGVEVGTKYKYGKLLVYLTNDFGRFFEGHDVYDSALRYYNLSLESANLLDMEEDKAFALNNIGLVFYYLNNYSEALENLEASVFLKRKNNISSLHISLMNIALIYNDQGKFDEALNLLNEIEEKYAENCNDYQLADLDFSLGYAYYHKRNFEKAIKYFAKSYEFAKSSENKKVQANVLHYLGIYSLKNNDLQKSQEYLESSLSIAEELDLRRVERDLYEAFQQLYKRRGDLEKVVEYQSKYMKIKDEIFNEQLASNLKEIQLDAQRKQSEVIIQQKDTEIERVRLITGLVGIISVLLIVVSVLIYRTYKASQRMKGILEKEITKRTAELVKSNADLTQMTQEYDQLVYRASHDIRGPLATLMGLTNIAKQDYDEPQRVKDYLGKIESTALGLNQTLSQLMETNRIRNLPICVENFEINELVESVFGSFKSLNHFPLISLRTEKGDWSEPLLTDKNLVAFVLTKLLDNAFRYFATHKMEKYIKVSWSQNKNETTIAVEDNGLGIDSQAKEKIFQLFYVASDIHGTGLGLFLAQMAANRLGGRIFLARSANPTIFKLVIATNLAKAQAEEKPVMTVAK